ncbi:hypothetical protein BU23DRAFT_107266 [Bimuria novae-zelandiae CBS 107.79]|uniref:Uncharacterized protein n=1 Tax=Bimuria novae-zelandiae CBS 107.79 TaxID=1447943 RepID=A0A6A5VQ88_9PLEO|nr:hypothetical protein BU23DRAFT_107266 [Bimuria novae-zelandiae CBS 107.79]
MEYNPDINLLFTVPGMYNALYKIRKHIEERLQNDPNAKSVINMSAEAEMRDSNTLLESIFEGFLGFLKENKIPFVVAAGNSPEVPISRHYPHKLGKSDNTLITVGGVNTDGTLCDCSV